MDNSTEHKRIVAALRALEKKQIVHAFDPYYPDSRPNAKQAEVLKGIQEVKYRFVVAGNRCIAKNTLIATSKGPVKIQDIKVGDSVFDENGKEIKVKDTFSNGRKEVVELLNRNQIWAESTDNHTWLTDDDSKKIIKERKVSEFYNGVRILRQEITALLGTVAEPQAYVIGALLGDGCSKQGSSRSMYISGDDTEILDKVSKILDCEYFKTHDSNYTWRLNVGTCNYYSEWCKDRYAHEKIVDLEVIKSWDRNSLLEFVAGLVDTDGSVYVNQYNNIGISVGMQAKSVIEAAKYAFLALWNIDCKIHVDDREKYVNGPVHYIVTSSNAYTKRILKELSPHLQTPRKKWKDEYSDFVSKKSRPDRVGIKLGQRRITETYDIHVDSETNLYCLANGLVTHNSGKSALAARELAWILTDTHPFFERPQSWKGQPLTVIIAGQNLTLMESELWQKKLAPFLDIGQWKQIRQGQVLKKLIHKENQDQIIFLSHSDGSENNRRQMQGYTAHYVWLDEMPGSPAILEELQGRIATTEGKFIATFTPKFKSDIIRRVVDSSVAPYAKKYQMSMLDNPKIDKEDQLARLAGRSKAEVNTILYGEWSTGESAVYSFDYDTMTVAKMPEGYGAGWRHVLSVDPALRSKCGYTLWAEDPNTGVWYLTDDNYIQGDQTLDPETLYQIVMQRSSGFNVCRRITDTMPYFQATAAKHGVTFMTPYSKNNRKEELIKNLQAAMSANKIKIGRWCGTFIDEIQSCQFREDSDKLVNSSSYHTLDCAQYFCDNIPAYDPTKAVLPWEATLYNANQKRREAEATAKKMTTVTGGGRIQRSVYGWNRNRINKNGR